MVYGRYNYSIPGDFVNQLTSLGGTILYSKLPKYLIKMPQMPQMAGGSQFGFDPGNPAAKMLGLWELWELSVLRIRGCLIYGYGMLWINSW